jgi:hypothetical protein
MEKIVSAEDLHKLPHKYQVVFAVFCAEQVIGLARKQDKEVCLRAIEVAKRWLRGEVSEEECRVAGDYAYAAGYAAAYAIDAGAAGAARATGAAHAAGAAGAAAYAAACVGYAAGVGYAAHAAANAARAATCVGGACAGGAVAGKYKNKVAEEQWNYYYELLNLDSNLEKILVG